jgi:hypothetical protein
MQDWLDEEINSIVGSLLSLLSFDHLIRSRQHVRRDRQPDLPGCLQVDAQIKLCRLFDWYVSRIGTLQHLIHIN